MNSTPMLRLFFLLAATLPQLGLASPECIQSLATPLEQYAGQVPVPFRIDPNDPREPRASREIQIKDLMLPSGQIVLFRIINANKYIKGFRAQVYQGEGGFSYSLDPGIALSWGHDEALLLVAVQSLTHDSLNYPGKTSTFGEVNYFTPLTEKTRLGDIAFYDEVKIPVEKENVVAILPRANALALFKADRNHPLGQPGLNYSVGEFLEKLAQAPECTVQ